MKLSGITFLIIAYSNKELKTFIFLEYFCDNCHLYRQRIVAMEKSMSTINVIDLEIDEKARSYAKI